MKKYYYDLHIHSCLSPCGDKDMTPSNIVGMAQLKELDIIALTDHNTCKNCPAIFESGKDSGILIVPGMEINTAEEIHGVCLFRNLESAMEFDNYVYSKLPDVKNNPKIYGEQLVVDAKEQVKEEIEKLLIVGTSIGIMELNSIVKSFDGVCFPAHIDKPSYSILSVLGAIPNECDFGAYEIFSAPAIDKVIDENPILKEKEILTNSDAHYLWDISERYHSIQLEEKSIDCLFSEIG